MVALVWDQLADRVYENGLDKGVLYLPDGTGIPWNGLTAVEEKIDTKSTPVHYDGMKISELPKPGSFSATLKALTYPDEFVELEGLGETRPGVFYGDQNPQFFALSYRTFVNNAVETEPISYKIHVIYNLIAIPSQKAHATLSADPSTEEFEWEIVAVPQEVDGFLPTAHIIINSADTDPWLLEEVEAMLYGNVDFPAILPSMEDLVTYITDWYRIKITDNGDGTWTADTQRDGFITINGDGSFVITSTNSYNSDVNTFVISDTHDITDIT